MSLQSGFTFGDWTVYPLEGRLVGEDGEQRIQPKSMDVLLYLAGSDGAVVEREEVLRHVWEGRAQGDEPLTRCIGELRRALGDTRAEPDYIQTIPKRGYKLLRPVAPIVRDTPSVDDAGDEKPTSPQPGPRTNAGRKILIAAGILLVAGFVGVFIKNLPDNAVVNPASDGLSTAGAINIPERSIAVLPFVNIGADTEQEYFSDGISEELINLLTMIQELRVISRTSAFSYKGKSVGISTISEQLNVAYVLEGSVRKSGNQVRISAQLIDARNDTQLWSESFDRTLDDIFATQDEIAANVVEHLKITMLDGPPVVRVSDAKAYTLVLQARYLHRQNTRDALDEAIALLERALAIDPGYATAWAGLALQYLRQADQGLRSIEEGYDLARDAANHALALDPTNVPAHRCLAWIAKNNDRDLMTAAQYYERALEMESANAESIAEAAYMAQALGRLDQAIVLGEYVLAHDPVSAIGFSDLASYYLRAGRLDEAISSYRTTLTLSPNYIGANYSMGTALLLKDEPDAALAAIEKEPDEGWRLIGLAMAYHALGDLVAADAALEELIEKFEQYASYNIAYVLAFRGESDRAFEWLNRAVDYKDPGLVGIVTQSLFVNLESDRRWLPFLESIGKSPEQLAVIEFKVALPE